MFRNILFKKEISIWNNSQLHVHIKVNLHIEKYIRKKMLYKYMSHVL